ncbi:hypothetical protein NQ317_014603 [Molorchus minor]|uniref:Uncharacterized protein n=1 Tax=Molorchus minor TaxID=1323400 RepID=A0ABQ9J134_9CUCU|nr:hypothetical protein NQ317_014603 [Molorchus minor]
MRFDQLAPVAANKIHGMPFDQVHKLIYKGQPNFLNMPLPKAYSEDIPADILSTLEINETLLDLYGFLQKVAVGLEQAIWDQEDNDGDFATQFKETEKFLRVVLCELLTALEGRGVAKRPDVTRDVLKDEDRRMDHTGAQSRDFKILREYITVLDYTVKALSHFMTHLS